MTDYEFGRRVRQAVSIDDAKLSNLIEEFGLDETGWEDNDLFEDQHDYHTTIHANLAHEIEDAVESAAMDEHSRYSGDC